MDFPITDVLQMIGQARQLQYDKQGVAVIMVLKPKTFPSQEVLVRALSLVSLRKLKGCGMHMQAVCGFPDHRRAADDGAGWAASV